MKRLLLSLIKFYQSLFPIRSALLGSPAENECRFTPTCSEYALEAIEKYGTFKGGSLAIKRILKCHPWNRTPQFDPVP